MKELPGLAATELLGTSLATKGLTEAKSLEKRNISSEKDIEKAGSGFEALLLQQMLKSMWATVETTGLMGEDSHAGQMYRDMFHQAVADSIAEGKGIGIKDYVEKELHEIEGKKPAEATLVTAMKDVRGKPDMKL